MHDNQGLALSAASDAAVAAYNAAVTELLDYRLSAMPTLKRALEIEPGFCMAHCLRGYMLMMMNSAKMHGPARKELSASEALLTNANERERMHVQSLATWIEGDLPAVCAKWEKIATFYPHDILAIRLHHFVSFWMGRSDALVSLPATVLPVWNSTIRNYGNVLGMMAFGLEEIGRYEEAEQRGREAVSINRDDLWAVHSVAHVLEMQGRHADGLRWLDQPVNAWDDRNPFRGHLWWHKGLYLIEARRLDEAVSLYDSAIYDTSSNYFLDLQNAASFLARLEFLGVNVGDRWEALANHAEAAKGDHELVFTDLHNVISLARARRFHEARAFIQSMRERAEVRDTYVSHVLNRVAIPMAESLLAFEQGDFEEALDAMILHKPLLIEVGASHAQRDLVSLYAIEAARRSGKEAALQHLQREREFKMRLGQLHTA